MPLLETERLSLNHLTLEDAPFILELLNQPSFIKNIGDRGVRSLADAQRYIQDGPLSSYQKHGFGLYRVDLKEQRIPIGMCGLLKRDSLPDVDIGYAFLERFHAQGYGYEAASAVMEHSRVLGLKRVLAIVSPDNDGSIRVLEKIGLCFDKLMRMPGEDHDVKLFASR
jgi:RimJ/RimL family protein N-acetyltransferase